MCILPYPNYIQTILEKKLCLSINVFSFFFIRCLLVIAAVSFLLFFILDRTVCHGEKLLQFSDILPEDSKTYDKMKPPKKDGQFFSYFILTNFINITVKTVFKKHSLINNFILNITCNSMTAIHQFICSKTYFRYSTIISHDPHC